MKPKVKPVAKKATKQTWRPLGEYEEVYKGDILKTNPNISYWSIGNEVTVTDDSYNDTWYFLKDIKPIALHIAETYHKNCDAYDKCFCSLVNEHWEPMPANAEEYRIVNIFRKSQRLQAFNAWLAHGISNNEVMSAIQNCNYFK